MDLISLIIGIAIVLCCLFPIVLFAVKQQKKKARINALLAVHHHGKFVFSRTEMDFNYLYALDSIHGGFVFANLDQPFENSAFVDLDGIATCKLEADERQNTIALHFNGQGKPTRTVLLFDGALEPNRLAYWEENMATASKWQQQIEDWLRTHK